MRSIVTDMEYDWHHNTQLTLKSRYKYQYDGQRLALVTSAEWWALEEYAYDHMSEVSEAADEYFVNAKFYDKYPVLVVDKKRGETLEDAYMRMAEAHREYVQ